MAKQGITLPQRNRGQNGGTPGSTSASGSTPRYSIAPGGPADGGPGDGNGDGGPPGGGFGGGFGGGGIANRIPAGVDPTKWQNALKACQSSLPTGGNFNSSAFQAYRSCLSDHGVTLPAQGSTTPATINRNDPKIQAALKTCAPLRPQGFGRSTTTTTPTKA